MTQPQTDKLYDHHRQQLSAMLDGQLPPDEAKFMLRRLEHDGELAACWERWQVCGDILRGRHDALLPADFSRRVVAAISGADSGAASAAVVPRPTKRSRLARWTGGAAIAASVAIAALFVVRQPASDAIDPAAKDDTTQVMAAASSTTLSQVDDTAATSPLQKAPPTGLPDGAAALATAAAVASVPTRRVAERSSRGQSQRAASRLRDRDQATPIVAAASGNPSARSMPQTSFVAATQAAPTTAGPAYDPFAAQPVAPVRPWPRAILPAYPSSGALTAKFDGNGINGSAFHPFEPRVEPRVESRFDARPAQPGTATDRAQPDATPTGPR